jgi:hypothetical protein
MIPPTSIDGTDITGATIDGTDVQEITVDGDVVFSAAPAGAFDITQLSPDTTYSTSNTRPTEIEWKPDGTKAFVSFDVDDILREYDCSTPFDFGTRSTTRDINSNDGFPGTIMFADNGQKFYDAGQGADIVTEYNTSSPFSLNNLSQLNTNGGNTSNDIGMMISDDGNRIYVGGDDPIEELTLSTNFSLSNVTNKTISGQNGKHYGLTFNDDGSKFYGIIPGSLTVKQYDLNSNYDLDAGFTETASVSFSGNRGFGITWSPIGDKFWIADAFDDLIREYSI